MTFSEFHLTARSPEGAPSQRATDHDCIKLLRNVTQLGHYIHRARTHDKWTHKCIPLLPLLL